jgi:hypothetical protein
MAVEKGKGSGRVEKRERFMWYFDKEVDERVSNDVTLVPRPGPGSA